MSLETLTKYEGGFTTTVNPVLVLGCALYWNESLATTDIGTIFATIATMRVITNSGAQARLDISSLIGTTSALKSLQMFLALPELSYRHGNAGATESVNISSENSQQGNAFEVSDVTISFYESDHVTLQDVHLDIRRGGISMFVGSAAIGKTALLRAILGELVPAIGVIRSMPGAIAYCDQNIWLPAVTIRQAITSGFTYVVQWYRAVLIACCLDIEMMNWPDGDSTVIGAAGPGFTRSQKQRIVSSRRISFSPSCSWGAKQLWSLWSFCQVMQY